MKKLIISTIVTLIVAGCGGGGGNNPPKTEGIKPINIPINKEYKSYMIADIHVKSNNDRSIIIWKEYKEEKGCSNNSLDCLHSALYRADKLNGNWELPKKEQDAMKSWEHVSMLSYFITGLNSSDVALYSNDTAIILTTEIMAKVVNGNIKTNSRVAMFLYKNGSWKPDNFIDAYGSLSILPKVAMDKNGNGLAIWAAGAGDFKDLKLYSGSYINGHWYIPTNLNDNIGAVNGGEIYPYLTSISFKNGSGFTTWMQKESNNSSKYNIYGGDFIVGNNPMWIMPNNNKYLSLSSGGFTEDCKSSMDTNGNKVLVWANYDYNSKKAHIYTSEYCNGAWHKPSNMNDFIDVNTVQQQSPLLGGIVSTYMNDNGFTIIAWSQQTTNKRVIYTVRYDASSCVTTISDNTKAISPDTGTDALFPKVVVNNSGQAALAWIQKYKGKNRLYIATYNHDSWQKPKADDYIGMQEVLSYDIAINDNGKITIAWSETVDSSHSYLYKKEIDIE